MPFYIVDRLGSGRNDDPFRPDLPAGTPFFGDHTRDGRFCVWVSSALPIAARRSLVSADDKEAEVVTRTLLTLSNNDPSKWRCG